MRTISDLTSEELLLIRRQLRNAYQDDAYLQAESYIDAYFARDC